MKIDEIIQAKFFSETQKAVVNLRYTSNFIGYQHNQFMERFDLTMPQFNILRILRGAKGPLNVNTIKERMIEKSPNSTRLMDKLIEKDLIKRIRCESDRRIVFAELTEKGQELLTKIDKEIDKSEIFNLEISEEEASVLSNLLDKMRARFEK